MKCEWFAKCDNDADGVTPHPVLGDVPICARCADKLGLVIEQSPSDRLAANKKGKS